MLTPIWGILLQVCSVRLIVIFDELQTVHEQRNRLFKEQDWKVGVMDDV